MADFGGRVPPRVVAAVAVADGGCDELFGRGIVERSQVDRHVVAAELFQVAAPERTHTAMTAEKVVMAVRAELVVAEIALPAEQAKVGGLDGDAPATRLCADRTIAAARAGRQVQIGLVTHGAAVTASGVGLFHGRFSVSGCSGG